jgi:ElaB/YqjD/DUF883 family membrane-anchored ribosome-binding protein
LSGVGPINRMGNEAGRPANERNAPGAPNPDDVRTLQAHLADDPQQLAPAGPEVRLKLQNALIDRLNGQLAEMLAELLKAKGSETPAEVAELQRKVDALTNDVNRMTQARDEMVKKLEQEQAPKGPADRIISNMR